MTKQIHRYDADREYAVLISLTARFGSEDIAIAVCLPALPGGKTSS